MNNIMAIAKVDITQILLQLKRNPQLWNRNPIRTNTLLALIMDLRIFMLDSAILLSMMAEIGLSSTVNIVHAGIKKQIAFQLLKI